MCYHFVLMLCTTGQLRISCYGSGPLGYCSFASALIFASEWATLAAVCIFGLCPSWLIGPFAFALICIGFTSVWATPTAACIFALLQNANLVMSFATVAWPGTELTIVFV